MSKLPHWFPLNVYQQDLCAMEWAFEIFIRLNTKDKVYFVAENHPNSQDKQVNIIYLLSNILPGFEFEGALKVFKSIRDKCTQEKFTEIKAFHGYESNTFDGELWEVASKSALNEGLSKYRNLEFTFDYAKYLASLPFHVLFSAEEKFHLYAKFVEKHKSTRAFPLIFSRNAPMKTREAEEFFRENAVLQPPVSKSLQPTLGLHDEHKIEYEQLLAVQPKVFRWGSKYATGNYFLPNFAFSDAEILDAVAKYLKANRAEQGIGRAKILNQLPKWKVHQILALWDLTEWGEKWTQKPFTQPELAEALWPYKNRPEDNAVDYVDRLRKLSKRDMKKAITNEVYSLLLDPGLSLKME